QQRVDEIGADEAGAAGDEASHGGADPMRIGGASRPRRPGGTAERPCYPRRPMRLIVTEKNSSAKKIAEILAAPTGGPKADKTYKVPYYTWTDEDGREQMTIGLKGHVVGPAFPEGYSNWQKTDLHDLIDAQLTKEPTDKNVVKAIRKM